ncbi:adenosylcobinamide-GDP ribazoletransferase [Rhodocyclus gracilis]|uniref:adenosylcobinamide-GDP ribazoletransferase n=1 Tax=Rhodocyclus gracilis TaxID=2929842 RepID=UPI0030FE6191
MSEQPGRHDTGEEQASAPQTPPARHWLRREGVYFCAALYFFTRLPAPAWVGQNAPALSHSARYFSAAGLIVGAIGAAVFAAAHFVWPLTLAVLLSMAATVYFTGAIHEDGWSDTVDGFGGGWSKDKILAIMRDSRIGSFGATALCLILLFKFCALLELGAALIPAALIAGHALSRFCTTLLMAVQEYAREEGKAKAVVSKLTPGELVVGALFVLPALAFLPPLSVLTGLVFALIATLWLARLYQRQIGGYTGDCLGAVQQLSEVAFYGGLLCKFS